MGKSRKGGRRNFERDLTRGPADFRIGLTPEKEVGFEGIEIVGGWSIFMVRLAEGWFLCVASASPLRDEWNGTTLVA